MAGDVEQRILAAFSHLLIQNGYQGTTTKKIAQAAQVNESTLFRHFKDKYSILQQLVDEYRQDIQTVGDNYQLVGDIEKDIMNFSVIYQGFIEQHLALFLTGIRESQKLPELKKVIKSLLDLIRNILEEKFAQMQNNGEIAQDIDLKVEIDNLILLNLGQAILQHSFPDSLLQIQPQEFVQNNIRTYAEHLKPKN